MAQDPSQSQEHVTTSKVKGNALMINNLGLTVKSQNAFSLLNQIQARQHAERAGFKEYSNTHLWEWTLRVGSQFLLKDDDDEKWRRLNIYIYIDMYFNITIYIANLLFVYFVKCK